MQYSQFKMIFMIQLVQFIILIIRMKLSRQISQSTNIRQYLNLQKYQNRQPAIYNQYFGINLIKIVDKLPIITKPVSQKVQPNLNDHRSESKGVTENVQAEIEHKVLAYHHQIDRLSQDIEINQYVISNVLLGRGAHSTVKLSKKEDNFYAIKIIWFEKIKKKYFLKQKQLTKMINAEINLLRKLQHPNIIIFQQAIYSVEKERIFIVLQYCAKGSLLNILNSKLTVDDIQWHQEVKGYFIQMINAITFMHQNHVIHRDIKPQNMLVNQNGQLKIIDFNISEIIPAEGTVKITNKFVGTKGYAAPELIINIGKQKIVNGKALDIWSLGITLLELLERKHPFNIKTIDQLHKYLSEDIHINSQYPNDLKDLLSGMLRRNSDQRLTIKQISKHNWLSK